MGDLKPKFNPNKEYSPIESDVATQTKPPFNPKAEFKPIEEKQYKNEGLNLYDELGKPKEDANQIIDNIPDLEGATESKKQVLKDLVAKGVRGEELSNSILTLQGKHPKQDGGFKYYYDENGLPIPLRNDEKAPTGHNVASIFGSPKDAENDNWALSTAKHIWNGVVGAAEGAISLNETATGLLTGDNELATHQKLKNAAQYLKFETPEAEKGSIYNSEGSKKWTDVFDPKRYEFTGDKVQGQILQGLESVVSFALGAKGAGTVLGGAKGVGVGLAGMEGEAAVKALTATSKEAKALYAASAYNMSLTQMIDAGKEAGLEGRDLYGFASVASVPQALLESVFGVGGLLTTNAAARAEMSNLARIAAKNIQRDASGKITKEGLEQLSKEMTVAATSVGKKYISQVAKTTGEEMATEGLQQFAEESSKQLYDKLKEDPKFKVDAFSPESIGKYLNATIAGGFGSIGPSVVLNTQANNIEKAKRESEHVFSAVQKGEESTDALKKNINLGLQNGDLTKEQHDDAIIRVNAYQGYNNLIANKNIKLDESQKKDLFEKTFQQENLESHLKGMGDISKLDPITKAEYNGIEKQSHDLQKDINDIILKGQLAHHETTKVGDKTIKDEIKKANVSTEKKEGEVTPPHIQILKDLYKRKEEVRKYADIPLADYNKLSFNDRDKHRVTSEHLETLPDSRVEDSVVTERQFPSKNNNTVFEAQMPDGKTIRFSSSMKRDDKNQRGNLMYLQPKSLMKQDKNGTWELDESKLKGAPIGLKTYTIENDGRKKKVIKIFSTADNADYGKFIGWAKETHKGKNDYSHEEINGKGGLIDIEHTIEKPLQSQVEVEQQPIIQPSSELQTITQEKILPNKDFTIEGQLQKESQVKGNVQDVIARIQKVLPKINVIQDNTIVDKKGNPISGKLSADGKTISINPDYAGIDTPIHEAGHVLIDAMGYDNPTIQKAIKQLQKSKLWAKTKKRYSELSDEMLAKEVLAEAIGREGAGIFNDEVNKSNFQKLLDRIFAWFKENLGLERNEAKELAKKILRGDVSHLGGEATGKEQLQIIGEKAKLTKEIKDNKILAEFLETKGHTPLEIRNITGWERGIDDKWRYEIDDANADFLHSKALISQLMAIKHGEEIDLGNLGDNFSYKELYEAYPELKNIKFLLTNDNGGYNANYNDETKTIRLSARKFQEVFENKSTEEIQRETKNLRGVRRLVLHELQHAVQSNEGYEQGGNSTIAEKILRDKYLAEASKEVDPKNSLFESFFKDFILKKEKATDWNKLVYSTYRKIAGEVEARNVEHRSKLTTEQKKLFTLQETEDIEREAQILSDGAVGGVSESKDEPTHADNLRTVNEALKQAKTADEKAELQDIKEAILAEIGESDEMSKIEDVVNANSLEDFTLDELLEAYNDANDLGEYDTNLTTALKQRIAYYLNEHGKEVLRKNSWFKEEISNSKDLSPKDVRLKVLSHMNQNFPELQQLSPIFDKAILERDAESRKVKLELEKLAKAVIKEKNKTLGIKDKAVQFFSSDNARYFEYMDDNGKFVTNTSNLSKAQIDLLNFMKDLVKDRKEQLDENGDVIENEILKTDKGYSEMMRSEGVLAATKDYFKIKPQGFSFDYKGRLTNKFDKPREKGKGYSKDFYEAARSFIDDYTHTKHMSKFVPIVNSLDYLYSNGYGEVLAKPEAKNWLNDWSQMHIYQTDKKGWQPADIAMKFFRTLTSQVVMGFNFSAAAMNIFMGNYNLWRKEGVNLTRGNGNLRLMGKGGFNKYGIDLLEKYDVVKADRDSNPTFGIGQLFQKLAFAAQTLGEYQIQGSTFLGQLSDEDYNSFEYKDGELVVKKGVDEDALVKRINEIKNKISDVQGKYASKDRRNFMRSEFGKMVMQFRVWMPDAWKERFGKRYIDLNGNVQEGTFTALTGEGFKELKQSVADQGTFKALYNNKAVMANLRGALLIGILMTFKYVGDDDDKKHKKALSLQNAINNLLFILDTNQLKYMVKSPFAAFGTVGKFIETFEDILTMDAKELKKDAPKIIPYSKAFTQIEGVFDDKKK